MKKNKSLMLMLLLLVTIIISGCQKSLEPTDAATLFINRLIYEAKDNRFEKNFVEGPTLELEMVQQRSELTKDLVTSFNEFGGVISPKQTEKFLKLWLEKMNDETYFKVDTAKYNKKEKNYTVSFKVNGLDFQSVYKKTMDKLVERMLADTSLATNNLKLGDLTMQLLTESMTEAKAVKKTQKVTLTVEKIKKKWRLVESTQTEETANILLVFMVGFSSIEQYSTEMSSAVTKAVDEALKQIEAEFAGKEVPKKEPTEASTTNKEEETPEEKKAAEDKKKRTVETVETIETYAENSKE